MRKNTKGKSCKELKQRGENTYKGCRLEIEREKDNDLTIIAFLFSNFGVREQCEQEYF